MFWYQEQKHLKIHNHNVKELYLKNETLQKNSKNRIESLIRHLEKRILKEKGYNLKITNQITMENISTY